MMCSVHPSCCSSKTKTHLVVLNVALLKNLHDDVFLFVSTKFALKCAMGGGVENALGAMPIKSASLFEFTMTEW